MVLRGGRMNHEHRGDSDGCPQIHGVNVSLDMVRTRCGNSVGRMKRMIRQFQPVTGFHIVVPAVA
jgi:hypothetical protein